MFHSLRTATTPFEHVVPYADTDSEEGETLIRFMPNFTAVAPVRSVPVMVTVVPPAAGPLVGLSDVTVGAAR